MSIIVIMKLTAGMIGILRKKFGIPRSFAVILRSVSRIGAIYGNSRWNGRTDAEAAYVRSILLLPAVLLELRSRCGDDAAMELMNGIAVKVSGEVDAAFEKKHGLREIRDPFERWRAYRNALSAGGFGLFNRIEDDEAGPGRVSYTVRRCIFNDCFSDAGVPELTHLICDYDRIAHEKLFPEFAFSRDGSQLNSIGHGKEFCRYLWEKK